MKSTPKDYPPKIVRGYGGGASGAVVSGRGFRLVRNGTGNYTITWTEPFADTPAFVATAHHGNGRLVITVTTIDANSVTFNCGWDISASAYVDSNFSFIAAGAAK